MIYAPSSQANSGTRLKAENRSSSSQREVPRLKLKRKSIREVDKNTDLAVVPEQKLVLPPIKISNSYKSELEGTLIDLLEKRRLSKLQISNDATSPLPQSTQRAMRRAVALN
jgi:hypothetical protein